MQVAAKRKLMTDQPASEYADLSRYVPKELAKLDDHQTAIPRIARDPQSISLIERGIHQVPTSDSIYRGDAREMSGFEPHSVHLVLTSPPIGRSKSIGTLKANSVTLGITTSFSKN